MHTSHQSNDPVIGGKDNVSRVENGENTLPFESLKTKRKSAAVKRRFSYRSIYKIILLVGDAAASMGGFALGLRLAGGSGFIWDDSGAAAGFLYSV